MIFVMPLVRLVFEVVLLNRKNGLAQSSRFRIRYASTRLARLTPRVGSNPGMDEHFRFLN